MKKVIDRVLDTQVLVIGGSGAGVTAAIRARKQGRSVLLVCKGKVGLSGNAIMAGGGFGTDGYSAKHVIGEEKADETYTTDQYFDNIIKEGYFISDQAVVEQFVEESPAAVRELLEWGGRRNIRFFFHPPAMWSSAGISWGRCLKQGFSETEGIGLLEDTTVVELLTEGGRICGALAVDIYTGDLLLIRAQAAVVATGGYQPFSFKNTVSDMTGDGAAMGYRAGARLADMEFLLAFPTAVVPRSLRGSIYPFIFEMTMRSISHRALDKYGKEIEIPKEIYDLCHRTKLSKLCSDYYWGNAILKGRGTKNGGVFMDFSQNDPALRRKSVEIFNMMNRGQYAPNCYKGDNIADILRAIEDGTPFEVGLGYEYSMGGLLVDREMKTDVPGLFAAGEAASGVFGACRAQDGLTEMLGQGVRAGLSAAAYCAGADRPAPDMDMAEHLACDLLAPLERKGGPSPIGIQARLESAADEGFGVIRDQAGMEKALKKVCALKEQIENMSVRSSSRLYNNEWLTACVVRNIQTCTEAGIRAAMLRKESRGCHIRSDYPQVDHDNWCVRILDKNTNGEHHLVTQAPTVTKVPLPSGTEPDVMSYFLSKKTRYQWWRKEAQ